MSKPSQKTKSLLNEISLVLGQLETCVDLLQNSINSPKQKINVHVFASDIVGRRAVVNEFEQLYYDMVKKEEGASSKKLQYPVPGEWIVNAIAERIKTKIQEAQRVLSGEDHAQLSGLLSDMLTLSQSCYLGRKLEQDQHVPLSSKDLISETQSSFEKLSTLILFSVRAILRVVDGCLSIFSKQNFNAAGETPFARTLTGRSQFFPHPILSVDNARKELATVSRLLETSIADDEMSHSMSSKK